MPHSERAPDEPPPPATGGRVRWGGHATARIEVDGSVLVADPLLRGRIAHLRRRGDPPEGIARDADAVLLSHMHRDHMDLPSLRRIPRGTRVLAPRGAARVLARTGLDVTELRPGDAAEVGAVRVTATHADHDGSRGPRGPHGPALGFLVEGSRRVYFAGDTDLFPGMSDLAPGLDAALVPIWGWGPSIGPGHLDPAGAADALRLLRPTIAVPIHWGTLYPAWLPPGRRGYLDAPVHEFARHARAATPGVRVVVLRPGEAVELGRGAAEGGPGR